VVGAQTEGEEYILLYLPCGDGLHVDRVEQSQGQTLRATCSLSLSLYGVLRQWGRDLLCT